MTVTIQDVAKAAGVSAATVCRALRAPEQVTTSTRSRVLQAVNELEYRTDGTKPCQPAGRTGNIGVLVPDLTNPAFPAITNAMRSRASESAYHLMVVDSAERPEAEPELIRSMSRHIDGLVLCSPRMPDDHLLSVTASMPTVLVNRRARRLSSVTADDAVGIKQVLTHLSGLGHRRVAYVAGPRLSWAGRERGRYLRACAAAIGIKLVEIGHAAPRVEGGMAATEPVLATGATAVVAHNDLVAIGLLNGMAERGIAVPQEMSVVGCDDIPMASMVRPRLTTIAQPADQSGRHVVDLLLRLLRADDRTGITRHEVIPQLVVRESTGRAAAR